MRAKTLILCLSLAVILASCGKNAANPEVTQSPYPSVPMNQSSASGENQATNLTPPPPAKTTDSFNAKGTEPFWAVTVEKNTATLSRPGTGGTVSTPFSVTQDDKGAIIAIRSVKGDFFLTLVKSPCSDGMSDQGYMYSATVNVGSEILRGCANRK